MIGTKDRIRMIGEMIDTTEMIGKLGKFEISMKEEIAIDNTETGTGTRKETEARIDIETTSTVLRIMVGIIIVKALLRQ